MNVSGSMIVDTRVIDADDRKVDDPEIMRMDFDFTPAQRKADMYLRFDHGSAPLASQSLGDLGADVIKVETLIGDTSRWTGKPERAGINGFFSQFNRNKRAISVDMKTPEGIDIVRRLAREADVIVCNYRPGVAERLGFGYDTLQEDNPGLVYIAVTGFGADGPYAERPAYDFVIQGMSGTMHARGNDGPPQMVRSVIADKATAIASFQLEGE